MKMVQERTNIVIQNIDYLFYLLKENAEKLCCIGYMQHTDEIRFALRENSEQWHHIPDHTYSLLEWFFENISNIKSGCKGLLVAYAYQHETNGYCCYQEALRISSEVTSMGLLVSVYIDSHTGWKEGSASEITYEVETFLLPIKQSCQPIAALA